MSTGPLFVSSGDPAADRRYQDALEHAGRGDFAAAVDVLAQTVERTPGFATAWFALGAIRERLGDPDGAIAAFAKARDADPDDYHGARLHLARLGAADALPEMTVVYVRRLFDQHAPSFDRTLVDRLGYRGPALLCDAVGRACEAAGEPMRFAAMLDLGCGTGLAGVAFHPHVERLVGVDLSPLMIAEADKRKVYDRLEVADVTAFLAPEASAQFNLVIAADVFVYMVDFADTCARIARVLTPGGLLAFTVETHSGDGIIVGGTLRYAHAPAYVMDALALAGFAVLSADPDSIRSEQGEPVPGLVVVARHN